MSKIIKRKIKRSMPVALVLFLISSIVSSLIFNYSLIQLPKLIGEKIKVGFEKPLALAQDTASTTVTVRNSPPSFTVDPAESPTSSSTSPVNETETAVLVGTASDPESNNWYLIVCSAAGVTAHNGAAPTCTATAYCVSGATAAGSQATCVYSNVTSAGETQAWYAYACDNHATEADCTAVNQGSGDSGSPLYVNHKTTINTVSTTVNNRDPGQAVTITATSTDTDTQGGNDQLYLSVCSTNVYSTSTGCGATTLCNATTTANGATAVAMSCNYTIPTPTPDTSYTYYAFIKDWHNLASTSFSSTYTVNNVAPSVDTVSLNGGANITLNMRGQSDKVATTTGQFIDNNGCSDVISATSTIYFNTAGANCAADNNTCYQILAASCSISGCTGGSDTDGFITCSTGLKYFARSTDTATGSPYSANFWLGTVRAIDNNAASGASTSPNATTDVIALTALDVTETTIPYGTIRSSQNSGAVNATTTVQNYGNTPLDSNVYGTDMTGPATISIMEQEWNTGNFTYGAATSTKATSTVGAQIAGTHVPRPTGADLSSPVYWGINIPAGRPSGNYSGVNTFAAVLYSGGNWN